MSQASQNECYIAILYTVSNLGSLMSTSRVPEFRSPTFVKFHDWALVRTFAAASHRLISDSQRHFWSISESEQTLDPIEMESALSSFLYTSWELFRVFFVKHFSNITGRFSLVTAWRRTPQAVAPSAALRFAPPVPQLQLAKQRCWGRQQGYQNPDQIKSKSEKKQCRQEMMWELKILHW